MHKCIILMFSDFMPMTFSVDIFTACIYVSMYLFIYLYTYLCMSVHLMMRSISGRYFRMDLCLLIMFVFVCMYVCMYVWMYVYMYFISFNSSYKCYSYESILFHVPIGRRSHVCSTGRGCGRGWEDIVGEARPY